MGQDAGFKQYDLVAFVTITDAERSRAFYRDTLGLPLVREELPFALVFDANGVALRLAPAGQRPANAGTVLGWQVPDIAAAARALERAGVRLERYEFLQQDDMGIWTSPNGARVAWFQDPDGNVLSISEQAGVGNGP